MKDLNVLKFLESIGPLPKIVALALQYLGVHEVKGQANNPVIMDMAKRIGAGKIYTSDDKQAWCAVFMFFVLLIAGKPWPSVGKDIYNLLRARTFAGYGEAVAIKDARCGDIVVMSRPGGDHVTIFIAWEKDGGFIGVGGNQSNAVRFSQFDTDRITDVRRYYATAAPASARAYTIDFDGTYSANEA